MLNNIPKILSPDLLKALCEMNHGDCIAIGDGNFPGGTIARKGNCVLLRADGHGLPGMLEAILQLMPLDTYTDTPVLLMEKLERDKDLEIPIWKTYAGIIGKHDKRGEKAIGHIGRQEFYEHAKNCYCIVMTGETSIYANVILQKGIVR